MVLLLVNGQYGFAEQGFLVVYVEHVRPDGRVDGLEIQTKADGSKAIVSAQKARLKLGHQTQVGMFVDLAIIRSPGSSHLVLISPWDGRVVVPRFEDESNNYVSVMVGERGDKAMLANGTAREAWIERIYGMPKTATDTLTATAQRQNNLTQVAMEFGLQPEDLEQAIRAWTARTPYEKGLKALDAQNYSEAHQELSASVAAQENQLREDKAKVAHTAFFLGQTAYRQGHYREAADAYGKAAAADPDNGVLLNEWALSLAGAGDYGAAEPRYRQALAIFERDRGLDDPYTAIAANNLALLLMRKGDSAGAESLFRRELAIYEKALGPGQPVTPTVLNATATVLNNFGLLLLNKGNYAGAEPLFRRALAIRKKTGRPDQVDTVPSLNNLAELLRAKGDLVGAEPLYHQALDIEEKALGPNHPDTARSLNNLALLMTAKGDYVEAERLFVRALAIHENVLGPNHPDTAIDLENLAALLSAKGDYAGAEPLFRRALTIYEQVYGPNHPKASHARELLARVQEKLK